MTLPTQQKGDKIDFDDPTKKGVKMTLPTQQKEGKMTLPLQTQVKGGKSNFADPTHQKGA